MKSKDETFCSYIEKKWPFDYCYIVKLWYILKSLNYSTEKSFFLQYIYINVFLQL